MTTDNLPDPSPRTAQPPSVDGSGEPVAATRGSGEDVIPFRDAVRAWFAISLQTFGGPAGQIAVMQRTLVDEKRWIGQKRFLHALSYCTLLPGPEAQQLAIYVGWLLNGLRGGLVAGILFVLPGVVALLGLSAIYVTAGDSTFVTRCSPASRRRCWRSSRRRLCESVGGRWATPRWSRWRSLRSWRSRCSRFRSRSSSARRR